MKAKKDDWETPDPIVRLIEKELGIEFTLDAAANAQNTKCTRFNSEAEPDKHSWKDEIVWCNCPYSHKSMFIAKAAQRGAKIAVLLLPASPDTKWFRFCFENADMVFFKEGRISFSGKNQNTTGSVFFVFEKIKRGVKLIQYLGK